MGLIVIGRKTSSNVQAVMWGLTELGLTAERFDRELLYSGVDWPAFLGMNPNGTVPVLRDGKLVVWESCAILRYLAARYGDGGPFWPSDPVLRAPVDQWAEWGKVTFSQAFTRPIFWSVVRTAAKDRDPEAFVRARGVFAKLENILESELRRKSYVTGERFTLADVVVGHILYRYFTLDILRPKRPNLAAYYARLCERPAFREHVMVDYSSLRHPEA